MERRRLGVFLHACDAFFFDLSLLACAMNLNDEGSQSCFNVATCLLFCLYAPFSCSFLKSSPLVNLVPLLLFILRSTASSKSSYAYGVVVPHEAGRQYQLLVVVWCFVAAKDDLKTDLF